MAGPSGGVPRVRTDLAYYGVVTRVISATQFVAAGLAGLGDGSLVGYASYVMAKANGTTTPPHAEQPSVTAYVSSSGTFTHVAYTAPIAVGDHLLLLHPNISTTVANILALVNELLNRVGWEGATSLADKLTLARALLLDNLDALVSSRATPADIAAAHAITDVLIGTRATPADIAAAHAATDALIIALGAVAVAIQTQTDRLAGGETVGTHVHANNVAWQTVVTIDPAGLRRKAHSIWLNFVNLTQNTIYRLSYNYGGLGVYVPFDSNAAGPWTPAMDDGVLIDFRAVIGYGVRLEIQSQVLEGAPRDVPYEVYWENME